MRTQSTTEIPSSEELEQQLVQPLRKCLTSIGSEIMDIESSEPSLHLLYTSFNHETLTLHVMILLFFLLCVNTLRLQNVNIFTAAT